MPVVGTFYWGWNQERFDEKILHLFSRRLVRDVWIGLKTWERSPRVAVGEPPTSLLSQEMGDFSKPSV